MHLLEDAELLRRYADEKAEPAFAELVRRHLDLVYSIALRQVGGDAHLADDVAQIVFISLARKARSLSHRTVLGGWLCRTAQFTAIDVVRAESRRRAREMEAHVMPESTAHGPAATDWEKLRPALDQAIGELKDDDRDAVVLRFFEGKAFAEVGARLRLTENAARMRVERALEKLRVVLARRGVTSTAAALGAALANQGVVAAPAALAGTITNAAMSGAASRVIFMSMTKLQIAAVGAVLVAGVVGWVMQAQTNRELRDEISLLEREHGTVASLQIENRALVRAAVDADRLQAAETDATKARAAIETVHQPARIVSASREARSPAEVLPMPNPDEKIGGINLREAPPEAALEFMRLVLRLKILRDPSFQQSRGRLNLSVPAMTTKREAGELLVKALRQQCGVELEPMPDGSVVAKLVASP